MLCVDHLAALNCRLSPPSSFTTTQRCDVLQQSLSTFVSVAIYVGQILHHFTAFSFEKTIAHSHRPRFRDQTELVPIPCPSCFCHDQQYSARADSETNFFHGTPIPCNEHQMLYFQNCYWTSLRKNPRCVPARAPIVPQCHHTLSGPMPKTSPTFVSRMRSFAYVPSFLVTHVHHTFFTQLIPLDTLDTQQQIIKNKTCLFTAISSVCLFPSHIQV